VIGQLLGAEVRESAAVDAAHRKRVARWWWEPTRRTALIDSAGVIGLAMLKPNEFHPFALDTFGLGLVLKEAARMGAEQCIVGIGGSATNDAGFGFARALGWQFLDRSGRPIEQWTALDRLADLREPEKVRLFESCLVAVDVQNPLLGPLGATRVYGPQKGLLPTDFDAAEYCLERLAEVARQRLGNDLAAIPGAGAAGGLGFGFLAFLSAQLHPGFEWFTEKAGLEDRLKWADLVITGEGAIDESTLMGKGVGQIGQRCRALGVPCIALGGRVQPIQPGGAVFTECHALTELTSLQSALTNASYWLQSLAGATAARAFPSG
ncbi:MAG TPA: glycerate kinase, partial [Verrucomicrobiae bacterium]|nr:glycerate kinase [Verrucomicrobiae bacterium]